LPREQIEVIHYGADTDVFHATTSRSSGRIFCRDTETEQGRRLYIRGAQSPQAGAVPRPSSTTGRPTT
jgi:hypothetical protein